MKNKSKDLIHTLYNDLIKSDHSNTNDIEEVLLKVYSKLGEEENIPLINRLVNYITFTAFTEKITFTNQQEELLNNLRSIGQHAGINGTYRSDYGNKNQF